MKLILAFLLSLIICFETISQPNIPVNGPKNVVPKYAAYVHVTLYTDYQTIISDATIIVKDGQIVQVGSGITIPKEARVYEGKGKIIYPAFIDLYTDYGIQFKPEKKDINDNQMVSSKPGAFAWNEAIRSEINASELFRYDENKAKMYRESGFGAVVSGLQDGICRGTSALVYTASKPERELIMVPKVSAGYSFSKGTSSQPYPSSLAGVIALLRQTFYDAQWYKSQSDEKNFTLEAFNGLQILPAIFSVDNKLDILRAQKIATEFKKGFLYKGAGDEYQRLEEIKQTNSALIVPVNFPKPFDIDNEDAANRISTTDLKHWEMAPSNLNALQKAGVVFAITFKGCEKPADFLRNIRKAVRYGLDEKAALKALTFTPASLIKQESRIGSLKPGMAANFIVTDGNIFHKNTRILECWSAGERSLLQETETSQLLGLYQLSGTNYHQLKITGNEQKYTVYVYGKDTLKSTLVKENQVYQSTFKRNNQFVVLSIWTKELDTTTRKSQVTIWNGKLMDSISTYFTATYISEVKPDSAKKDSVTNITAGINLYPFTDYGYKEIPKKEKVLFRNATIWTNEKDSILYESDLLIDNGKIKSVGKNIQADGATVIDATGKFLTSGIIDEHSHIALTRGVNEGTQAVTSEVRMGDAISSEDINIYRQLAGGVVASQLLHGSANPIGGQSAMIKLRWGNIPELLKVEGADGFIKFALGENVKQSNWGDRAVFRYPQTRMGVEQTDLDAFTRAKEYRLKKSNHIDLELEALVEILDEKRFITCHSYVQSEINMLMHLGDSMGFKVNTFTHILEGYKVADKMKAHGAGASTFADWWAYKYEVMEAIPYNAAILNRMGIITAINSDDAEMGRRLNQEAAKTIKYGGVSEMDAWKMVTLNPAKLLHLDSKMGSIKTGKDADVVLWSDNPLTVYAKVLYTFVDGTCYYSEQKDKESKEYIQKERWRIMQKMMAEKQEGEKTEKKISTHEEEYHCDTETDYGN